MRIETWVSNKGGEEIHHFVTGTQIYLFGINRKRLGEKTYRQVYEIIRRRNNEIEDDSRRNNP